MTTARRAAALALATLLSTAAILAGAPHATATPPACPGIDAVAVPGTTVLGEARVETLHVAADAITYVTGLRLTDRG